MNIFCRTRLWDPHQWPLPGRHESGADSGFGALISSAHIMVSARGVRGKPFPKPSRKTEEPSLFLQTKINNQRT